jgi:FtsP/CotA-like multicopper oxidase with cupredoxin domain
MVLSDISVNTDGSLVAPDNGGDLATLFGREGNTMLVNGKVRPTLKGRPGRPQRWRLINAAKARYFQISLPGHTFTRIGGDGGLMNAPVTMEMPVLAPAERADLIVVPTGNSGDDLVVRWVAYDRGWGTAVFRDPEDLLVVHLEGTQVPTPALPAIHRDIAPLSLASATPITISLDQVSSNPFELGINGTPFKDAPAYHATVGETQIWTITNTIDWNHPFHLHGFFFQPLTEQLTPREPIEWKDTIDVPVNQTVRFAVKFDDRPGMWMFHCHLLDHAEAGMMAMLMVEEPAAPAAAPAPHAH